MDAISGDRPASTTTRPAGSPAHPRRAALAAFARALAREEHVLAERPDLLWQQLYNR